MRLDRKDKDADFWETAKSPCCQKPLKHHVGLLFNKPHQSWICKSCGTGWNSTKSDTWNYEMQKTKPMGKWAANLGSPNPNKVNK